MLRRLSLLLCVSVLFPALAWAQDAGVVPLAEVPAPSIGDVLGSAQGIVNAGQSKKWALFFVLIVVLLSKVVVWGLGKAPWAWAKLLAANTVLTTWVVPIVGSIGGALATTLAAPGQTLNADILLQAVLIGLAGSGWGGKKAKDEAVAAGAAAAAAVKAPEDVLDAIGKSPTHGPNP